MKFQERPKTVEAFTFEELVAHGKANGGNMVEGVPLSFEIGGVRVTHENDDCYLIPTLIGSMRMNRGDMLVVAEGGAPYPYTPEAFEKAYMPLRGSQPIEMAMNAIDLIKAERERQVSSKGWTPEHDLEHERGELAKAGACYALAGPVGTAYGKPYLDGSRSTQVLKNGCLLFWPWTMEWWHPTPDDRLRELVKAGALIAAEIDRELRHVPGYAMETAPKDGTEVSLLVRHANYQYAQPEDRDKWQEWVTAKWIDFNDGGWTWRGLMGTPIAWRPLGFPSACPACGHQLGTWSIARGACSVCEREIKGGRAGNPKQ